MSSRGWHQRDEYKSDLLKDSSSLLVRLRSVVVRVFLCAVECSGAQQCKWPSNDTTLLKRFLWIGFTEGRFQTLSCSLFLCHREARVLTTNYLNISMKVTNFIAFLCRVQTIRNNFFFNLICITIYLQFLISKVVSKWLSELAIVDKCGTCRTHFQTRQQIKLSM